MLMLTSLFSLYGRRYLRVIAGAALLIAQPGISAAAIGADGAAPALTLPALPSCTVTGNPAVDFGSISRGRLMPVTGGMTPGIRRMVISAGCTLPQPMKLRIEGTARGSDFSWGGDDSVLRLTAREGTADAKPVLLQRLNAAGSPVGQPAREVTLTPGDTLVAIRDGVPAEGRQLGVTLDIVPVLGGQDSRPQERMEMAQSLEIRLVP